MVIFTSSKANMAPGVLSVTGIRSRVVILCVNIICTMLVCMVSSFAGASVQKPLQYYKKNC